MGKAAGFTLGELARTLRATLEGDPAAVVTGVAPLESAGPSQISFLVDVRFAEAARASGAGAFLAGPDGSGPPGPGLRVHPPPPAPIGLLTPLHPPTDPGPGLAPSPAGASDATDAPTP